MARMKTRRTFVAAWFIVVAACGDSSRREVTRPSFDSVFPALTGPLMTVSSPRVVDLNGDGKLEIIFGTGMARVVPRNGTFIFADEPDPPGYVLAVDGPTNRVLWQVPHPGDAFTTAQVADLNGDRVLDVVMGGREAAFRAYSGSDGKQLWQVDGSAVAKTPQPYSFFTPAFVRDVNGDGVQELVVGYGGDDLKLSSQPRSAGYIALISGKDGKVLASHRTPDGSETYCAVIAYDRRDGQQWVIFGTGGETFGGSAYRVPVSAFIDGSFAQRTEPLLPLGRKGVMAPAILLDINGDGEQDIVISTFDGRLAAINGATGKAIWQEERADEESYHPPAVMRVAPDRRPGLFISRGLGTFPRYRGSVHRLHDAANGRVLYEYQNTLFPGGAPIVVDLDGDGIDEPFFFSVRYPNGVGARIHLVQTASSSLITHDLPTNYWTTPAIADARGRDTLELIGLSWLQNADSGLTWQLSRLNLGPRLTN